ncbi:MAG: extracellular solute-binding protein [Peptococcaceae bacterium]|nr:extracellular solute-binding protein [Peptococcaceae bacterium]
MKREKKGKFCIAFVCLLLFLLVLGGCQSKKLLDPNRPVTLTLWHNFGGQMRGTMDAIVDKFNATVGADEGIVLSVTSISGSADLHKKLTMAANGDPGAPALPDISTVYPKTALILAEKGLLLELDPFFTEEEIAAYIPRFIEEGRLTDKKLYVFPFAKSTEVLFVNKTIFNRFSQECGISLESLATFEGILEAAEKYYEWTDKQTPEIANDGKAFYVPDSLFNFAQVSFKQLGKDFIKDGRLQLSAPEFLRIWNCYYPSAVRGHIAIFNGYGSDLAKTGDIVCSTGSTAGVLFFSPTVTHEDNTSEPAEYAILPYPVFEGGEKVAIQRGSGLCVMKSAPEKEYAAVVFLKWFTAAEQNLDFVSSTGYLPVTKEAYDILMDKATETSNDPRIAALRATVIQMQKEYDFYIPPVVEGFDEMQKDFEELLMAVAYSSKEKFQQQIQEQDQDPEAVFDNVSKGVYEQFINDMIFGR